MSGGRDWTRKEESTALAWSIAGLKHAAIAKRLSRTQRAVSHKIRVLRLRQGLTTADPRQHKAGELSAAVSRLSIPGTTDSAIADILGISRHAVAKCRRRLGLPPGMPQHIRLQRIRPEQVRGTIAAKIVRLYGRIGMADAEMARRIGCTKPGACKARVKLGLPAVGVGRGGGRDVPVAAIPAERGRTWERQLADPRIH